MGNTQVFCHRVPAITSSFFASCGLLFSAVGGSGCSFINVFDSSAAHGTFIPGLITDDSTEHTFLPPSVGIGPICTSPYYGPRQDGMWNASQGFFISSLITGSVTCITFCAISYIIPPTDSNWKFTSVMSAISAVLQVPIFLLLESRPCTIDENHSCRLSSGAFLIICSIICYVFATVTTQCTDTPRWAREKDAWRVRDEEEEFDEGFDDDDEEAGHFPSFYDRETAMEKNRRKIMLMGGKKIKYYGGSRNRSNRGGALLTGWKRWWNQHWHHTTMQASYTESEDDWEYPGGGEHMGFASMPPGVTAAEPDGKSRSLPTEDAFRTTETGQRSLSSTNHGISHTAIRASMTAMPEEHGDFGQVIYHEEKEEMRHSKQNTSEMLPLQSALDPVSQQTNVPGLSGHDSDDIDSRLLLRVDPVTGLRIAENQNNLKVGLSGKKSEAVIRDGVSSLDPDARLAEQERVAMTTRNLGPPPGPECRNNNIADLKQDEEMYFGDDDGGDNDSLDGDRKLAPPSLDVDPRLAPPSMDGRSINSPRQLDLEFEDDEGDTSYSSASRKYVEMKEAAAAASKAVPLTKQSLAGGEESTTTPLTNNLSVGRMSTAMKWLRVGRSSSMGAHDSSTDLKAETPVFGNEVKQSQHGTTIRGISNILSNDPNQQSPTAINGNNEIVGKALKKDISTSSPIKQRSLATSPTKTMTTDNSITTPSPTKKSLILSVRAMLGGNLGSSAQKNSPDSNIGKNDKNKLRYTKISDHDVSDDHGDSTGRFKGTGGVAVGDDDCLPSYSEESSAGSGGAGGEVVEPWLVEEQSDQYHSSVEGDDALLLMSSSLQQHCNTREHTGVSSPSLSSQQLHAEREHHKIEPFADWKELNDAMAAGALAASETNQDTKIFSPQEKSSVDRKEAHIEDPDLEFYSSADETPSSISISSDNASSSERDIPAGDRQKEKDSPFSDLSGTDEEEDNNMRFSQEGDDPDKVSRAMLGKPSTGKRRKRRRKTSNRSGSGSICSRNSLLDTTIDEETDQELMEFISGSESDHLTASSSLAKSHADDAMIFAVDHYSLGDESEIDEPCLVVSPTISGKHRNTTPDRDSYEEGYLSRVIIDASNSVSPLSICSSSVSSKRHMTSSIASSTKKSEYKSLPDDICNEGVTSTPGRKLHYVTSDSSNSKVKEWGASSSLRRQRLKRSASMPARRKRSQVTPVSSDNEDFSTLSRERPMKPPTWRDDRLKRSIHCPIDDGSEFQSSDSSEPEENGGGVRRRRSMSRRRRGVSVSSNARSARIRRLQMQASPRRRSHTCDPAPKTLSRQRSKVLVYVDGGGLSSGPEELSV